MRRVADALRRPVATLLAIVVATVAATSCGSGEDPATSSGLPDTVTVGVIAIVDVAPLYLGRERGFFSKRNIDLALQVGTGGTAAIGGVVDGRFEFGFSNVTSLLVAREHGQPLKIVANGNSSTGEAGRDFSAVVVKANSPIHSPKDLAGRTVSVNILSNIGDTTIRASVRRDGGDASTVRFVEVPFPEAPAAVAQGRVDAAWVVEPFLTIARDQGLRVVCWNMVDASPKLTVATYFATERTIAQKPDLTRRFTDAVNESLQYAQSHPDEARAILSTYTQIAGNVRNRIILPDWLTELNRDSITQTAVLAEQDGLISKPDARSLMP